MASFFMDVKQNDLVPKGGGIPSRAETYHYVSKFSQEAIDVLVGIMRDSRNENLKMGAAKALLDKCIPDLKATEITGEQGGQILIRLVTEADGNTNKSTDSELPGSTNDL